MNAERCPRPSPVEPLPPGISLQTCGRLMVPHQLERCIFRPMSCVGRSLNTEQRSISVFLSGNCLLDVPRQQISGPEELPGQTYDATQQCNLTFGPEYSVCPGMDVCTRLWCAVVRQGQMVCLTKKLPAVEGTPCGKGRICLQGKCVDKTKKKYYSVSDFVTQCLGTQDLKNIPVTCVGAITRRLYFLVKIFFLERLKRSICSVSSAFQGPEESVDVHTHSACLSRLLHNHAFSDAPTAARALRPFLPQRSL